MRILSSKAFSIYVCVCVKYGDTLACLLLQTTATTTTNTLTYRFHLESKKIWKYTKINSALFDAIALRLEVEALRSMWIVFCGSGIAAPPVA